MTENDKPIVANETVLEVERNWRMYYGIVAGELIAIIVMLFVFTRMFS